MARTEEHYRQRIGLVLAVLGLILIVGGVLLVIQYQHDLSEMKSQSQPVSPERLQKTAVVIQWVLFFCIILILIFLVSLLFLMHWTRRFRAQLFRRKPAPTPVIDVWSMHKLPDDLDDQPSDEDDEAAGEKPNRPDD